MDHWQKDRVIRGQNERIAQLERELQSSRLAIQHANDHADAAIKALSTERKRAQAMHRRAQKAEGKLSRIMEILEFGEKWDHQSGRLNSLSPSVIPRFYLLESLKRARRK